MKPLLIALGMLIIFSCKTSRPPMVIPVATEDLIVKAYKMAISNEPPYFLVDYKYEYVLTSESQEEFANRFLNNIVIDRIKIYESSDATALHGSRARYGAVWITTKANINLDFRLHTAKPDNGIRIQH